MLIKQISVFIENRTGRLREITTVLRDAGIDIRAMSVADTTDFGILRLIVDKPEEAQRALANAKMTVSITSVIGIAVSDRPGGLCSALDILFNEGVAVEYCYAFISHASENAHVIPRVDNNERAVKALSDAGFQFPSASDLYQ